MQNWLPNQQYQGFFDYVLLLSREDKFRVSIYDSKLMQFIGDFEFNQIQDIDELVIDFIKRSKSFIFATYGRELMMREIPLLSKTKGICMQVYFLQFIDIRQELFQFMLSQYPQVFEQLNNQYDRLITLMCAVLHIFKEPGQKEHDIVKRLLCVMRNEAHPFQGPIMINPQQIYQQELYLQPSWFNTLPENNRQTHYLKVRGIPFNYGISELQKYYNFVFSQDTCILKFNESGLFMGEAYFKLKNNHEFLVVSNSNRQLMEKRYLEVFESNLEEYTQVQQDQPTGSILKLRGLPWSATKDQIRSFLGNHGNIQKIKMKKANDGKPTGECFVILSAGGELIKQKYNRKTMGQRYIEIFMSNEKEMDQARSRSRS